MKKNLILINNLEEIKEYEKVGITNFLFAVKEFSIGYNEFDLKDIPYNSFLLINRILDSNDIDKIKEIKEELLKYRGIIFEDVGIYNIFKDDEIELIWNQNHFATNEKSINYWLQKVKSVIVSNEITKEEIEEIVNNAISPIVFNVFGKNMVMYSRRYLLSNFNDYKKIDRFVEANILDNISRNNFLVKESKYGTVLFTNEYFNYQNIKLDDNKVLYYLYMNQDLSVNDMIDIINGKPYGNDGFLNKKTIYKVGGGK